MYDIDITHTCIYIYTDNTHTRLYTHFLPDTTRLTPTKKACLNEEKLTQKGRCGVRTERVGRQTDLNEKGLGGD